MLKKTIKKLFFLIKLEIKKIIPSTITPTHVISIQEAILNSYASIHFTNKSYTLASEICDYNIENHYERRLDSEYPILCNYIGYLEINNATIHSANGIVSINDSLITELFDNDSNKSVDDNYLRYLFGKSIPGIEKAFIVSTSGQWGYYHFLMDFVPRLLMIHKELKNSDKIVVANKLTKFQNDFFELANIKENLVLLKRKEKVSISKIISPLFTSQIGNPNIFTIKSIRDFFFKKLSELPIGKDYPKRIYISRFKAKSRRISNENELEVLLNKYSITKIHLEDLTLMETCNLFAKLDFVIAPHGAGLANLVFSKRKTNVIEIFPKNHLEAAFYRLSIMNDLNYSYLVYDSINKNKDIKINLVELEEMINSIF